MRLAHLTNYELRIEKIPICNLYHSFRSGELEHTDQVAMTKEAQDDDNCTNLVYPCNSYEEL